MKTCLILALVLSLTACASKEQKRVTDIAATPLRDFNLTPADIPPVLTEAKLKPYQTPADQSCEGLRAQVSVLDEVLGPDVDVEAVELAKAAKAKSAVSNAAAGALQKTVEGAIPFRGWVRKLSGAERHSAEATAAISAGTARRAFLKGMAVAKSCQQVVVAQR
ncbi:hypothetical protein [Massilia sp. CF038]|uniref:hypothetical protein n=1 Tax=Massilia sp. CF038 TaxID=1881045 RepID=UPI00090F84AA|nr:hypothetical protein [Massilia sp. CF038]SHH66540.1 hypothetical protein SAMN05428948_4831 [Massilia sp. CF038]